MKYNGPLSNLKEIKKILKREENDDDQKWFFLLYFADELILIRKRETMVIACCLQDNINQFLDLMIGDSVGTGESLTLSLKKKKWDFWYW